MADELTRKKGGMGSGNMSTPATTSSNASGSGYGYAPLYEALAQSLGYSDSASAMADAAMDTGTGTPASTGTGVDIYSDDSLANMTTEQQLALRDSLNPTKVLGVNIEEAGLGAGVSLLTNLLAPTPMGILGLAASTLAKRAYNTAQLSKQVGIEGYIKGNNKTAGDEMDNPLAPVSEPADAITAITEKAINPPPVSGVKVAEDDDDPLGTWIRDNIPDSGTSQTFTPSQGPNTGTGSGFDSSTWGGGSSYSSGDSGSDSSSSGD